MRGTPHRILSNAGTRREEARNEIAVFARRGGDDAEAIEAHKRGHIRPEVAHGFFGIEYGKIIARFGGTGWGGSKPLAQLSRCIADYRWARRKIEREQVVG